MALFDEVQRYSDKIEKVFFHFFHREKPGTRGFQSGLATALIRCFHIPIRRLSQINKVKLILNHLFLQYSCEFSVFRFSDFLDSCSLKKTENKKLLIALLYGLYFKDVDLFLYREQTRINNFEFLMFQIMAERISLKSLQRLLTRLSLDKQVCLICHSYKNYREGSYILINQMKKNYASSIETSFSPAVSKSMSRLLWGLEKGYFDLLTLYRSLLAEEVTEHKLENIILKLEEQALEQTREFRALFNSIVRLMIESPTRLFNHPNRQQRTWIGDMGKESPYIEQEQGPQEENGEQFGFESLIRIFKRVDDKEEQNPFMEDPTIDVWGLRPLLHPARNSLEAEKQKQGLKKLFEGFISNDYSFEAFHRFCLLFGFSGHVPYFPFKDRYYSADNFVKTLHFIHIIFSHAAALEKSLPREKEAYFVFILTISQLLYHSSYEPLAWKEGLDRLCFAIPTKGKKLSSQPAIISLVEGLKALVDKLNTNLLQPLKISDYPIFIFDQSDEKLFDINRRYINKINRLYQCNVVHISKFQALSIAEKLGIERLLDTTRKGEFGFGGSRNSVFLLTPILKQAFSTKRKIEEILEMENNTLLTLFERHVLGGMGGCGNPVLMIDDDMHMPEANMFSYVSLIKDSHTYDYRVGYHAGRATKFVKFMNLNHILYSSVSQFGFTRWLNFPMPAGMSEYIGHPKFCLNLPAGSEEMHYIGNYLPALFLRVSYHLGGSRYPSTSLPTHFFVGLETHLKTFIPYVLTMLTVWDLTDPCNHRKACALPWNNRGQLPFSCLKDVFNYVAAQTTIEKMKKMFWRNVDELFHPLPKQERSLFLYVNDLMQMNVDSLIESFKTKEKITSREQVSLNHLAEVYKFCQRDAYYFWNLGKLLIEKISFLSPSTVSWSTFICEPSLNLKALIDEIKQHMEVTYEMSLMEYPIAWELYLLFQEIGAAQFNETIKEIMQKVASGRNN